MIPRYSRTPGGPHDRSQLTIMKVADHPKLPEIQDMLRRGLRGATISDWLQTEGHTPLRRKQINDYYRKNLKGEASSTNADPIKILAIDIETSPMLVYTWGLWKQNVGLSQIVKPTQVLCFSAKFLGASGPPVFYGPDLSDPMHNASVIEAAWELLNEADVVLHYNGDRFDTPHLQREFMEQGLPPTSPFESIDLLKVVRKQFRFPSNKLQYVSQRMELAGKETTGGFELWVKCMDGDPKAWATMKRYNIRDVALLEEVYEELLPWIPGAYHPNLSIGEEDTLLCPRCGSGDLHRRGVRRTKTATYPQYQCQSCTSYFRGPRRESGASTRF